MGLDVKVNIDLKKPVTKAGSWLPLIVSEGKDIAYKECSSLEAIVAAGFAAESNTYKAAELMWKQENAPDKIAVVGLTAVSADELAKIANYNWHAFIVVGGDAAVYEVAGKVQFLTVDDADGLSIVKDKGRAVGFVHSDPLAVAAIVGNAAGMDAGSFTYKNMILNGVAAMEFTDEEVEAIHTAGGFTVVVKAGDIVTTEGKAAGGEYIDILDSEDYVIQQLEYQTQKALNNAPKIPYDNNGIAILESVAVNVMKDAFNKGIIGVNADGDPAYSVTYALKENSDAGDRGERKYLSGSFSFELAGAIHTVAITGEIIV